MTHDEQFSLAVAECVVAADRLARERTDAAYELWHRCIETLRALWLARPVVQRKVRL